MAPACLYIDPEREDSGKHRGIIAEYSVIRHVPSPLNAPRIIKSCLPISLLDQLVGWNRVRRCFPLLRDALPVFITTPHVR